MSEKGKKRSRERVLETRLTSLERDFRHAIRERLRKARSVSSNAATEFMDMASDSEIDEMTARLAEADSQTLREIQEALRMLREGRYGSCQACGERISRQRLKARPFATLCIKCKEKSEHRAQMPFLSEPIPEDIGIQVSVDGTELEEEMPSLDDLFKDSNVEGIF